jgi:hypothetical protein
MLRTSRSSVQERDSAISHLNLSINGALQLTAWTSGDPAPMDVKGLKLSGQACLALGGQK